MCKYCARSEIAYKMGRFVKIIPPSSSHFSKMSGIIHKISRIFLGKIGFMNTSRYISAQIFALILSTLAVLPTANARTVTPDPVVLQQIGDVAVINIADEGSCNADILITPLDLSIVLPLSTNPTLGIDIDMEIVAKGVGTTKILVQWVEFGVDNRLNLCLDIDSAIIDVIVGPVPLVAQVRDAQTNLPVTNAQVYARDPGEFYGFRAHPTATAGVYTSPPADYHEWDMKVFAPGYEPSAGFNLVQAIDGTLAGTVYLAPDPANTQSNVLKVRIRLLDSQRAPTGQLVLTDTIELSQNQQNLRLNPTFGGGNMIFPGVPSGTIGISAPDTQDIDFSTTSITLGTGVVREVILNATLLDSSLDFNVSRSFTRGSLPGSIVGDVVNSAVDPNEPVEDAIVISKQYGNNIATYVETSSIGSFYHPNIQSGNGEIFALSPDETIQGPTLPVSIVAGQVYGDHPSENTALSVPLHPADADGDGLPDNYEDTHFQGYPYDQSGANDDPDGDGLTNMEEYQHGTDPTDPDSDGDGYADGVELELGTDPVNAGSTPPQRSLVWVDFGYTGAIEAGTLLKPAGSLHVAMTLLSEGGTIRAKGDVEVTTSTAPGVFSTRACIESLNGDVTVTGQ